jgi:hypothetical protein
VTNYEIVVVWESAMNIQDETSEFMRATDGPPTHPRCEGCSVPMWLVSIEWIGTIERKQFECKACDARLVTQANA